MKTNCDLIRDLLPLYAEHITSEATNALVEEHLAECEACRAELEQMEKPVTVQPEPQAEAPLKKIKSGILKKRLCAVLIAAVVVVCITAISARCYNKLAFATVEEAKVQIVNTPDRDMLLHSVVVRGEGVYLRTIDFDINNPVTTMQAVKYAYPRFHALLKPLVTKIFAPDPYNEKLLYSRGSSGTELMVVECADDTLYYQNGEQVYRYAIQRSDGTTKYVYGTPDSVVGRRYGNCPMNIDSIYRLYFRDVFLFLQGLTHSEPLAEELTQETFFKALDGLKDYDGRQDVRAWLFTVARNTYYSYCRRNKRTVPLEDAETSPADTPDIAQLLVDKDAAFTVHQCLHTLEEPYKEVFSLRVFGELPFERIGAIFGHNASWARVTYYRAKTKLQQMLEAQHEG